MNTEYFCTECEKDIEPKNIHIDYGFVKWHKFKSKSLYKNIKTMKNKHLCICEKCFQNYAVLNINNHPKHRIIHFKEYVDERGFK